MIWYVGVDTRFDIAFDFVAGPFDVLCFFSVGCMEVRRDTNSE